MLLTILVLDPVKKKEKRKKNHTSFGKIITNFKTMLNLSFNRCTHEPIIIIKNEEIINHQKVKIY